MAAKKSKGTRKATVNKRMANRRRKGLRAVIFPWLKRFGIIACIVIGLIWAGSWFFLSDADTKTARWIEGKAINQMASLGFKVDDILVEGRVHADADILMAILNTNKGDPLFGIDLTAAQNAIEEMTWIERARVERRWPKTIYVGLSERTPIALWQRDKKLRLLDNKGQVIAAQSLQPFKDMIIIIGDNAPEHANALIAFLSAEDGLLARVEAATRVSGRRWDITLKNEISIKMPEDNFGLALRRLMKEHAETSILDKDLKAIDMREQGRIIVRTKPGKVQEYRAGYSATKNKSGNNI